MGGGEGWELETDLIRFFDTTVFPRLTSARYDILPYKSFFVVGAKIKQVTKTTSALEKR